MRKKVKRIAIAAMLLLALLLTGIPQDFAVQAAEGYLEIRTKEDWLTFAKNCKTDVYSQGLQVELKTDLDLTGESDLAVPVFCGTFNGGGHSVTGIWLETTTDTYGLFRIISPDAVVSGLTVYGALKSGKERKNTGLLCGENYGTIRSCSVFGFLKSYENVGGIAGRNAGTIENGTSHAMVQGTLKTGGVVGLNEGTLTGCQNYGSVNGDPNESAVSIGGIAGANEGVMTSCSNYGNIGYLHTGYNIGGITGLSRGFMEGCSNSGTVFGRRDVGGIAGQMEPSFRLEYGKNAMALLNNSVSGFSDSLNNTMAVIESAVNEGAYGLNDVLAQFNTFASGFTANVSWLFSQMNWMQDSRGYIEAIRSELQVIKDSLPGRSDVTDIIAQIEILLDAFGDEDPSVWEEQLQELMNLLGRLGEKIRNIPLLGENVSNISGDFRGFADTVVSGFQSFGENSTWILEDTVNQIANLRGGISGFLANTQEDISAVRESVGNTLKTLSALQGSVMDVLDGKSSLSEDLSAQVSAREKGMIVGSENIAEVSADYNVGGILGNLSAELSLDQESDALPSLDDLLFTDTTLFIRATVYACKNSGDVSAKYDYTGGTLGYGTRGAILNCENSGNVLAERGYAGGIAGYFRGNAENDTSIGKIETPSFAGGITGSGKFVGNCKAISFIEANGANCGAIAGSLDSGSGNLFVNDVYGGVNDISFAEVAQAVSYEDMIALENTPQSFRNLSVRFVVDGKTIRKETVPYGSVFPKAPPVESKDGKFWNWNEPEVEQVFYNQTLEGEWKNFITTLSTEEETPKFLAEGTFDDFASLEVAKTSEKEAEETEIKILNILPVKTMTQASESWKVFVRDCNDEELTVRFLEERAGCVYSGSGEGMKKLSSLRDGKYLVFPLKNGGEFTFVEAPDQSVFTHYFTLCVLINAALLIAGIIALIIIAVTRKKKKSEQE